MYNICITILYITIIVGFLLYILEKNIRIENLKKDIESINEKNLNNNMISSIYSDNKELPGKIILLILFLIIIAAPIFYILDDKRYATMGFLMIIGFLALIKFWPYSIKIENNKFQYKHLIETLNKVIIIPIEKIENISYYEETIINKIFSIHLKNNTIIDINVFMINNFEKIKSILEKYFENIEKTKYNTVNIFDDDIKIRFNNQNNQYIDVKNNNHGSMYLENKKQDVNNNFNENKQSRFKVRINNDSILFSIFLIIIEFFILFSIFVVEHTDLVTILFSILVPVVALKLLPYKIYLSNNSFEYKHILYTKNKLVVIPRNNIVDIYVEDKNLNYNYHTDNYHRTKINIKYCKLYVYTKDSNNFCLKLLNENFGDIRTINKKDKKWRLLKSMIINNWKIMYCQKI